MVTTYSLIYFMNLQQAHPYLKYDTLLKPWEKNIYIYNISQRTYLHSQVKTLTKDDSHIITIITNNGMFYHLEDSQ